MIVSCLFQKPPLPPGSVTSSGNDSVSVSSSSSSSNATGRTTPSGGDICGSGVGGGSGDVDVGLMLKLQSKIKDLERDKKKLRERLENMEEDSGRGSIVADSAFGSLRVSASERKKERERDREKRGVAPSWSTSRSVLSGLFLQRESKRLLHGRLNLQFFHVLIDIRCYFYTSTFIFCPSLHISARCKSFRMTTTS